MSEVNIEAIAKGLTQPVTQPIVKTPIVYEDPSERERRQRNELYWDRVWNAAGAIVLGSLVIVTVVAGGWATWILGIADHPSSERIGMAANVLSTLIGAVIGGTLALLSAARK